MTELMMPDYMGAMNDGLERGKKQGLAQLYGQAYNAAPEQRGGLLAKIAGSDGQLALAAEKSFNERDDDIHKQMATRAGQVVALYKTNKQMAQQMYAGGFLPIAARAGVGQGASPQLDDSMIEGLTQLSMVGQKPNELPTSVQEYQYGQKNPGYMDYRRQLAEASARPQYGSHNGTPIRFVPGGYQEVGPAGGGQAPHQGAPQQPRQDDPSAGLGDFNSAVSGVLGREGGYVANDAGAGPTNFGINSRANPDVDVRNLTPGGAKQIYKQRYWDAIGADNLPPQIREMAFDTAVNQGVGKAKELIAQSGGDPTKFAMLRSQHYASLAQGNPQKYGQYAEGWQKRVQETGPQQSDQSSGVYTQTRPPIEASPKTKQSWAFLSPAQRKQAMEQEAGLVGGGKDAPSGYQWNANGSSLVPITGGPADRKNNPTPADQAKGEMSMRKEVSDRVKESRSVMQMYQKVQAAATQASAPNDLALIFGYMKMLDPGSVVREQEFANAQNAAGIPDQVRNAYNKALSGERLNPNQRQAFLSSAQQIASVASKQVTDVAREYQGISEQYGYDTQRATGMADFRNVSTGGSQAEEAQAPNVNTKAEYDALPSGTVYMEDGKQYRKP